MTPALRTYRRYRTYSESFTSPFASAVSARCVAMIGLFTAQRPWVDLLIVPLPVGQEGRIGQVDEHSTHNASAQASISNGLPLLQHVHPVAVHVKERPAALFGLLPSPSFPTAAFCPPNVYQVHPRCTLILCVTKPH